METKNPHDSHQTGLSCGFWRRWRDSNSRARFQTYSLSRGAPSPTWVHLQMGGASRIFSCGGDVGGESGIRTHGSFESPVFKTGSLNRSDISPYVTPIIIPYLWGQVKWFPRAERGGGRIFCPGRGAWRRAFCAPRSRRCRGFSPARSIPRGRRRQAPRSPGAACRRGR